MEQAARHEVTDLQKQVGYLNGLVISEYSSRNAMKEERAQPRAELARVSYDSTSTITELHRSEQHMSIVYRKEKDMNRMEQHSCRNAEMTLKKLQTTADDRSN